SALARAFSAYVSPISSACSSRPVSAGETSSQPQPSSNARSSASLPALFVARRSPGIRLSNTRVGEWANRARFRQAHRYRLAVSRRDSVHVTLLPFTTTVTLLALLLSLRSAIAFVLSA